jgi:hypothetical protein
MFELKEDSAFKQHLRDFLVQTKSFADKNNADLFAEEAAAQREVRPPCTHACQMLVQVCNHMKKGRDRELCHRQEKCMMVAVTP